MSVSKTKKYLILIADILIIPALILCERLTDFMLSRSNPCPWTLFGGKCVSCGGTENFAKFQKKLDFSVFI